MLKNLPRKNWKTYHEFTWLLVNEAKKNWVIGKSINWLHHWMSEEMCSGNQPEGLGNLSGMVGSLKGPLVFSHTTALIMDLIFTAFINQRHSTLLSKLQQSENVLVWS